MSSSEKVNIHERSSQFEDIRKNEIAKYGQFLDHLNEIIANGEEQKLFNKITNVKDLNTDFLEMEDRDTMMALMLFSGNRMGPLQYAEVSPNRIPGREASDGARAINLEDIERDNPNQDSQIHIARESESIHYDSRMAAHDLIEEMARRAEEQLRLLDIDLSEETKSQPVEREESPEPSQVEETRANQKEGIVASSDKADSPYGTTEEGVEHLASHHPVAENESLVLSSQEDRKGKIAEDLVDKLVDEHKQKEGDKIEEKGGQSEYDTEKAFENLESQAELDLRRERYFKAMRMRGMIASKGFGAKIFGRYLEGDNGEKMIFGNNSEGNANFEKVKQEYLEALQALGGEAFHKSGNNLSEVLGREVTQEDKHNFSRKIIVDHQMREQKRINELMLEGFETGKFDKWTGKFRSGWRSGKGTIARIAGGFGLTSLLATPLAPAAVGGKMAMGATGTYFATEALLEKRLGFSQRGWVDENHDKVTSAGWVATATNKEEKVAYQKNQAQEIVSDLDKETIFAEVARLRALQVFKGTEIDNAFVSGLTPDGKRRRRFLVDALVQREADLRSDEAMARLNDTGAEITKANVMLSFLDGARDRETRVTKETDEERVKRMARKITATGAALTVGWAIGHFLKPEVAEAAKLPDAVESPGIGEVSITIDENGEGMIKAIAQHLEQTYGTDHEAAMRLANESFLHGEPSGAQEMYNLVHLGDKFNINLGGLTAEQLKNMTVADIESGSVSNAIAGLYHSANFTDLPGDGMSAGFELHNTVDVVPGGSSAVVDGAAATAETAATAVTSGGVDGADSVVGAAEATVAAEGSAVVDSVTTTADSVTTSEAVVEGAKNPVVYEKAMMSLNDIGFKPGTAPYEEALNDWAESFVSSDTNGDLSHNLDQVREIIEQYEAREDPGAFLKSLTIELSNGKEVSIFEYLGFESDVSEETLDINLMVERFGSREKAADMYETYFAQLIDRYNELIDVSGGDVLNSNIEEVSIASTTTASTEAIPDAVDTAYTPADITPEAIEEVTNPLAEPTLNEPIIEKIEPDTSAVQEPVIERIESEEISKTDASPKPDLVNGAEGLTESISDPFSPAELAAERDYVSQMRYQFDDYMRRGLNDSSAQRFQHRTNLLDWFVENKADLIGQTEVSANARSINEIADSIENYRTILMANEEMSNHKDLYLLFGVNSLEEAQEVVINRVQGTSLSDAKDELRVLIAEHSRLAGMVRSGLTGHDLFDYKGLGVEVDLSLSS